MNRQRLRLLLVLLLSSTTLLSAQDSPQRRGRKYKPPPDVSHIVVQVLKKSNGKPIPNAAVVFNPEKDGRDEGNLEVKTDPDGKAIIDVIPTGSLVRVQIIANGFATFADDFQVDEASREITVHMLSPQEQISAYENNEGKSSTRKPGVQEPEKPATPPPPHPAKPNSSTATPPDASSTPKS